MSFGNANYQSLELSDYMRCVPFYAGRVAQNQNSWNEWGDTSRESKKRLPFPALPKYTACVWWKGWKKRSARPQRVILGTDSGTNNLPAKSEQRPCVSCCFFRSAARCLWSWMAYQQIRQLAPVTFHLVFCHLAVGLHRPPPAPAALVRPAALCEKRFFSSPPSHLHCGNAARRLWRFFFTRSSALNGGSQIYRHCSSCALSFANFSSVSRVIYAKCSECARASTTFCISPLQPCKLEFIRARVRALVWYTLAL